jgi:hypothetical protein
MPLDAEGKFTDGKYKGYTPDQVAQYTETLEAAVNEGKEPPPAPGAETPDPNKTLTNKSAARLTPLEQHVVQQNQRLEQDDEDAFSASVDDYDDKPEGKEQTYRQLVAEAKKNLPLAQKLLKGIHKHLYMMIKQQDPEVQKRLLGRSKAAEPPVEPVTPPAPPEAPKQEKPKAVPPVSATPTPAPRAEPTKEKKTTLRGNAKTEKAARSLGRTHEEHLLRLEENGVTQAEIDNAVAPRASTRRETVFDRHAR